MHHNTKIVLHKGEEFGNLTYTGNRKIIGEGRSRRYLGEFICKCGNTKWVRSDTVAKGNTRSCGCKSPNKDYKKRKKTMGDDYPYLVLFDRFRKNAKKRNVEFTLSIDDLKQQFAKQNGHCAYTGEAIVMPANFIRIYDQNVASIDRIDSKVGYVPGNIQLTTKKINMMKHCMSHEEFIATCRTIVDHACGVDTPIVVD